MKKLKYGLLLILTMILFSVPVLAAKTTYYLPSKIVMHGDTYLYSYDKYGHLIEYSVSKPLGNTSMIKMVSEPLEKGTLMAN